LYGLPPQEFTAARNARAKQARRAGDRELAEAIGGLAKPSMAAWLVNQMAREYPQEMESLAQLGSSLREATRSLDAGQLPDLTAQRRRVVHALVQQARSLGRAAGHPVSQDTARGLEETLHAALADAGAAAQVRAGRLTRQLTSSGFPQGNTATPQPRGNGPDRERLAAADRDLAEARAAVQDTTAARDRVAGALDEAQATAGTAADRVAAVKQRLDEAAAGQADADRALRAARGEAGRAERRLRQAEQRLKDATQRRRRLRAVRPLPRG
jgi:hypothetical protein